LGIIDGLGAETPPAFLGEPNENGATAGLGIAAVAVFTGETALATVAGTLTGAMGFGACTGETGFGAAAGTVTGVEVLTVGSGFVLTELAGALDGSILGVSFFAGTMAVASSAAC
jgi:hypothetical protein